MAVFDNSAEIQIHKPQFVDSTDHKPQFHKTFLYLRPLKSGPKVPTLNTLFEILDGEGDLSLTLLSGSRESSSQKQIESPL